MSQNDNNCAVIFDLDGTLLDTVKDIANAVNDTLLQFGYPTHSVSFYEKNIGGGINDLIDRSLPKGHNISTETYIKNLDHYYKDHLNKSTKVYPHIYDILNLLQKRDIPMAVISNKRHPFAVNSVDRFFKDYFQIVIGSGPDYPLKPNPTSAEHVLNVFNADPAKSYFVGDTEYDILTAKNSNMMSLAVSWGMISREELLVHQPDHIFDEPKKLLDYFKEI